MRPKAVIKNALDIAMTVALLFLMGFQFWGDTAHEWVGTAMFLLFILHQVLNLSWYKNLFKGKYNPMRIFQIMVNLLVLAAMLAQMYSGIVMSGHVFAFLPIGGGMSLARRLHILGSHWGFVLMSVHLGLHWNMVIGMANKNTGRKSLPRIRQVGFFLAGLLIAAYGLYAFVKRDFLTYMLLQTEFVFMDFSESKILFYLDYLALMGLCVFVSHYLSKALRKISVVQTKGEKN